MRCMFSSSGTASYKFIKLQNLLVLGVWLVQL